MVVITDRNDLDNQLFGQFANCKDFLWQTPVQAESRTDLRQLLAGRCANGIIFTTMQKFEESDDPLSLRRNIIVIADEAHRSQYGLEEKINATTGKISVGTARKIRDSLPNATYIGFTGTPISSKDKDTREIFGDYIDIYDMTQSVEDGATRTVYYESRVITLHLTESIHHQIDQEYDIVAEEAPEYVIEKSKRELSRLESILAAPQTIEALCLDIVSHYETNRQYELTGKAMIVAYSRDIAMKIYRKILDLRPAWQEKIGVVMTSANNDPEEWRQIIGTKAHRDEMAKKFKDDTDPLKIAIVVDMWLTGFDVPSLATMYVYKPMSGHNLMQAIARVNRVFGDKEGGLVVDYVGIARDLRQAMHDYTRRDRHNYGDTDISKVAKPRFDEKLEVCRDLLHGYDYSCFSEGTDLDRARAISGGVDFLSAPNREETKKIFIKESLALRQALSLCRSLLNQDERLLAAYFEAVRTLLTRVESKGQLSLRELNDRINELLKQSIQSEGVINLFSDIKQEFSLFDPKFLADIAKMKEKNLAVELLKRLLADQISVYQRTNLVQSERFSDLLSRSMSSYLKGMLTNEQVIEELLGMAKDMASAHAAGEKLGLTVEETAFYDALTKPAAVKDFYENEELIAITRELTDLLRKNKTIDWQKKETARAGMRRLVKRLLKEHRYPPEGMEDAVNTVIRQCELWTDAAL
ncbi:MAG: HsdR family type I site-specific deoxyribonuclease [Methanocorpusculum sp.]|nr:HsdR family type I site-specific deoxyribonuclease [Methanocorpusculum sp.]